jgi:hypothetical protein
VVARQGLEAARNAAGAEEVVLTTSAAAAVGESGGGGGGGWAVGDAPPPPTAADGSSATPAHEPAATFLLEGTQTNFFALSSDGRTLLTAPEGAVLGGTVRRLVVDEVAPALGLRVLAVPPTLAGAAGGGWAGAFLTSTSRLVLPVDELLLPVPAAVAAAFAACATGAEPPPPPPQYTTLPLGSRDSAVLAALEAAVAGAVAAHSTRLEL